MGGNRGSLRNLRHRSGGSILIDQSRLRRGSHGIFECIVRPHSFIHSFIHRSLFCSNSSLPAMDGYICIGCILEGRIGSLPMASHLLALLNRLNFAMRRRGWLFLRRFVSSVSAPIPLDKSQQDYCPNRPLSMQQHASNRIFSAGEHLCTRSIDRYWQSL
jgi:hypothetical protein